MGIKKYKIGAYNNDYFAVYRKRLFGWDYLEIFRTFGDAEKFVFKMANPKFYDETGKPICPASTSP